MGRNLSGHSESPVRVREAPRRRSPSRRERSPARHRGSHKASSPPREKPASRTRSPRREKSRSSVSRSPSPRTKRLRRAHAETEPEKVSEREHGRNHDRGGDRATHRERGSDREVPSEKRERKPGRDTVDSGSYRSRQGRSTSPSDRHHRSRHRSRSPHRATDNSEVTDSGGAEHRNGDNDSVAIMKATEEALETKEKQKPSFELSGKLAAETNRVRGVTLLFNEPPDARKPDIRWRLYVFKAGEVLNEPLYVHRQSCYLFGRERRVADIPTDHPSCSKQHAVLQYRQVEKEQPDGTLSKQPRICDTARELSNMSINYHHGGDIKTSCFEKSIFYLFLVTNRTSYQIIELNEVSILRHFGINEVCDQRVFCEDPTLLDGDGFSAVHLAFCSLCIYNMDL